MKKNLNNNTSDILIDELQKKILNSPSLKNTFKNLKKSLANSNCLRILLQNDVVLISAEPPNFIH